MATRLETLQAKQERLKLELEKAEKAEKEIIKKQKREQNAKDRKDRNKLLVNIGITVLHELSVSTGKTDEEIWKNFDIEKLRTTIQMMENQKDGRKFLSEKMGYVEAHQQPQPQQNQYHNHQRTEQ